MAQRKVLDAIGRISLRPIDVGPDGISLPMPMQRSPVAIGIVAVLAIGFCFPYFMMGEFLPDGGFEDLFDIVSFAFTAMWFLGWSVAVFFLLAVLVALSFGRERMLLVPGRLGIRIEVMGAGMTRFYQGEEIKNLRFAEDDVTTGTQWRGTHVLFDYGGEEISLGSALTEIQAQRIIKAIREMAIEQKAAIDDVVATEAFDLAKQLEQPKAEPDNNPSSAEVSSAGIMSASTIALLIANGLPIVGVLFFEWSVGDVMLLFWTESAVIGIYNVAKMWCIGRWMVLLMGPFFVGHFGGFMAAHLLFIYGLFIDGVGGGMPDIDGVWGDVTALAPAVIALFISHGISFFTNFLGKREYETKTLQNQMHEPYRRIIVMHVTLIFGGFLVMVFENPVPAMLLMIVLKIGADLRAHLKEHTTLATQET